MRGYHMDTEQLNKLAELLRTQFGVSIKTERNDYAQ